MNELDLAHTLEHWAQIGLQWIGFGTVVGLVAKAVMPGRDPGGSIATLMMGIVGSVIGGGALALLLPTHRVTPISPLGFVVATGGALVILGFYRLFVGRWVLPEKPVVTTTVVPIPATQRVATTRKRRAATYHYDE